MRTSCVMYVYLVLSLQMVAFLGGHAIENSTVQRGGQSTEVTLSDGKDSQTVSASHVSPRKPRHQKRNPMFGKSKGLASASSSSDSSRCTFSVEELEWARKLKGMPRNDRSMGVEFLDWRNNAKSYHFANYPKVQNVLESYENGDRKGLIQSIEVAWDDLRSRSSGKDDGNCARFMLLKALAKVTEYGCGDGAATELQMAARTKVRELATSPDHQLWRVDANTIPSQFFNFLCNQWDRPT